MMDLYTAHALTTLATETSITVALVGDPQQATPVGHAGAMTMAVRATSTAIELNTVHRFRDPTYAALTLELRDPHDQDHAREIAQTLLDSGHVARVDSIDDARAAMVDGYFHARSHGHTVAVVCGTNNEADTLSTLIQQHRIAAGELHERTLAWGGASSAYLRVTRSKLGATTEPPGWRTGPPGSSIASTPTSSHQPTRGSTGGSPTTTPPSMSTSPTRPPSTAFRATPLTPRSSVPTSPLQASTSASPAAATETRPSSSRGTTQPRSKPMTRGSVETSVQQSANAAYAELARAARTRTNPTAVDQLGANARALLW